MTHNTHKYFTSILSLIMLFSTLQMYAQVKGNKNLITKKFSIPAVEVLEVNLSADLLILTQATDSYIEITTDENLIELISRDVKNGTLDLNQAQWISASNGHTIKIGAPNLRKVITSAHGKTQILDLDQDRIEVAGNVGRLTLQGQVNELDIQVKLVEIDASELVAQNAKVEITSWGSAIVQVVEKLEAAIAEDGKLEIIDQPKNIVGETNWGSNQTKEATSNDIKWIDFKLKNNSLNRHQFMVIGKKPKGGSFSYGFPMWPGQTRTKHWPTGSKVYKVNRIGIKRLVFTLDGDAEGGTANIFAKEQVRP